MNSPIIDHDDAADLYESEDGAVAGPWTKVGGEDPEWYSRQSRWHDRYWLVVRDGGGTTWGLEYGIGLTESQENDLPWDALPVSHPLKLTRLYPHTVTKTEYRTTPGAAS